MWLEKYDWGVLGGSICEHGRQEKELLWGRGDGNTCVRLMVLTLKNT
jgi:hypothetical protein